MKNLLLTHWKAKLASLLIAIAVWYLVRDHVRPSDGNFFRDPGAQQGSVFDPRSTPGIVQDRVALVAALPAPHLHRLVWLEADSFESSIWIYPGHPLAERPSTNPAEDSV